MADAKSKVHTVIDGRINHNGKMYKQYDQIELEAEDAARLLKKGLVKVGEVKAPAPAKPKPETKEAK